MPDLPHRCATDTGAEQPFDFRELLIQADAPYDGVATFVEPTTPGAADRLLRDDRLRLRREHESALIGLRYGLYTATDALSPRIAVVVEADAAPPSLSETLARAELLLTYAQILARFRQEGIDGRERPGVSSPPATHEHAFYGSLLSDLCVGLVAGDAAAGPAAKRQLLAYADRHLGFRAMRRVRREPGACSVYRLRGLHRLLVEVRDAEAEAVLLAVLSHLGPNLCGFGRAGGLDQPRAFRACLAWHRERFPASARAAVETLFCQILDGCYARALRTERSVT